LQSPSGYRVEVSFFFNFKFSKKKKKICSKWSTILLWIRTHSIFKFDFLTTTLFQDLYEDVDYGILSPATKIKVKVNPSGVVILRADVQPERFSKRPYNPFYFSRYN
jgi:hypothetical protein